METKEFLIPVNISYIHVVKVKAKDMIEAFRLTQEYLNDFDRFCPLDHFDVNNDPREVHHCAEYMGNEIDAGKAYKWLSENIDSNDFVCINDPE